MFLNNFSQIRFKSLRFSSSLDKISATLETLEFLEKLKIPNVLKTLEVFESFRNVWDLAFGIWRLGSGVGTLVLGMISIDPRMGEQWPAIATRFPRIVLK